MNLHEYQVKKLFADHGVPVPRGLAARTAAEAVAACAKLGSGPWAIKAQVHAGGRGKAGGVKLARNADEIRAFADSKLGTRLITIQTDARGQPINTLYIEECVAIARELYLGAVIDRSLHRIVFMASTEGGVEIEEVAAKTPELILRAPIDPLLGAQPWQGRSLAFQLGLRGDSVRSFTDLFCNLAHLFETLDCLLLEVNPLVITDTGEVCCLDAKVNLDDNALFRHPDLRALRDSSQEDEREAEAARFHLNYVALDGNIACMVNGAGLAMGTMDLIKHYGGNPANFLDVGGGASKEAVAKAFRIILSDSKVRVVLINIFGGIVSCATIADGIIAAVREVGVEVPVVVRFEGNNAELGKIRLEKAGLDIMACANMQQAAAKVVAMVAAA